MPLVNKTFSDIITFSRGSNATMFDSSGTLVYAPNNLLLQSEDLSTTWNLGDGTVTANSWTSPTGAVTGDIYTVGTNSTFPNQSVTVANLTTYILSFYYNKTLTTSAFFRLRFGLDGTSTSAWVDAANNTFGAVGAQLSGGAVTDIGNNIYRVSLQIAYGATDGGSRSVAIAGVTANSGTTPDTGNDLAIWGAQLNIANTQGGVTGSLSTYYPTTSAAYYGPRLDYDPATLAARGLLIEEQRTNSLTYSESLRTQTLTVTITGGTFQNGETVTATGGGTGTYISASSTLTSFGIWNGTGVFTGTLTGGTSGATATISTYLNEWLLTRSTTSPDVVTAPNGTLSADKLVEDTTASNTHFISARAVSVVTTSVYALSVFLKAAERTWALVNTGGTPFGTNGVYIDLSTGALGSIVGTLDSTPTVQNCGNGWYRVTITKTPTTNGNGQIQVRLATGNGTTSYTGDGTSGIYIWGAQLEAGAFATSYIPTTTTALTRSADVAAVNTLSPWFNAAEGTLYVEGQSENATNDSGRLASINNGTAAERFELLYSSASEAQAIISDGNVTQASFTEAVTKTNVIKIALAYEINNSNASINGSSEATDTSCTMPTVTQLNIGSRQSASNPINGHLRRITYYPRRLSNAELVSVTS